VKGESIQGAIFDVGNVLIQLRPFRPPHSSSNRDEAGRPAAGDPLLLLRRSGALDRLERGLATDFEFFDEARRILGIRHGNDELQRLYEAVLGDPMPGMAELLEELHRRGVKTVGLSDISFTHLARIQNYPAVRLLGRVVASCRTGYRKPEPESFRAALLELGTQPAATLFVDDRPDNIDAGAKLGLRAVLFEGSEALRGALFGRLAV